MEIIAQTVNDAFRQGCQLFARGPGHHPVYSWSNLRTLYQVNAGSIEIQSRCSRNGPVLVLGEPVLTRYLNPTHRVLLHRTRDANPFFHLFESLWMLAGRRDVEWLSQFNSNIANYSDDGKTFWGAYGYRWRKWFGHDQLKIVINELSRDIDSRRAVICMWDGSLDPAALSVTHENPDLKGLQGNPHLKGVPLGVSCDIPAQPKDLPCNTILYPQLRPVKDEEYALDLGICCRSNDMIWGAYGANAVHFSVLQEYLAFGIDKALSEIRVVPGVLNQWSYNFHLYMAQVTPPKPTLEELLDEHHPSDQYPSTTPITQGCKDLDDLDRDILTFCTYAESQTMGLIPKWNGEFIPTVAVPMLEAWRRYKDNDLYGAYEKALTIRADDWSIACLYWISKRKDRRK